MASLASGRVLGFPGLVREMGEEIQSMVPCSPGFAYAAGCGILGALLRRRGWELPCRFLVVVSPSVGAASREAVRRYVEYLGDMGVELDFQEVWWDNVTGECDFLLWNSIGAVLDVEGKDKKLRERVEKFVEENRGVVVAWTTKEKLKEITCLGVGNWYLLGYFLVVDGGLANVDGFGGKRGAVVEKLKKLDNLGQVDETIDELAYLIAASRGSSVQEQDKKLAKKTRKKMVSSWLGWIRETGNQWLKRRNKLLNLALETVRYFGGGSYHAMVSHLEKHMNTWEAGWALERLNQKGIVEIEKSLVKMKENW